ncbi:ferredoxin reductase family protein [Methylobacter luteus]|uniref:ferredoxin reductase family protein n=1 Tax=Methylobacter luteus TaxID=415 RepID=UPI000401077B|nr:ferredoxin reductase family protein [Methylobacter luteus]
MKYGFWQTLSWIIIYLGLALLPTALAIGFQVPPARSFPAEFGAMLGLLALGVLAMQPAVSGRHRWFAEGAGMDNVLQFHRQLGIFALLLVLAHPAAMLSADPAYLAFLDPRADLMRAASLSFVVFATLVLVTSSLLRLTFGLSYERWRTLHGVLSLLIVTGGLGHALLVDNYFAPDWKKWVLVCLVGLGLLLILDSRLLRPFRMLRRPWRVVEVIQEPGDATTLVFEAEGHTGMKFRPGQFAWLTLGDTPFSLQQHPFSICSSAVRTDRLAITAKALGDFTDGLSEVKPGTRAWLEGPYGVFFHDAASSRGAVFIAGGVGITPIISMLRTYRDLGSDFPLCLIYANSDADSILFRAELDEIAAKLPLTLVYVLTKPPEDWHGETGYVDADLLDRYLPEDNGVIEYFLCGPPPMMDSVEPVLIARGAALNRVYSERFNLV